MWIAANGIMSEASKKRPSIQQEFSRRDPTPEDEYFYEQERLKSVQEKDERAHLNAVRSPPTEKISDGIWGRLYRSLTRHFDTKWRP
jgi:tRNA nucleotidyltransferase (CCA-adding enzyme)